ncbi:MAG TPA: RNA polymerase sigma factor [Schlesneria sp.]
MARVSQRLTKWHTIHFESFYEPTSIPTHASVLKIAEMTDDPVNRVRQTLDETYRSQSRKIFATLVRLIGDFDLAEEALHEAFAMALTQWQQDGIPGNPAAWLVSTGRFKAIDVIRRRTRFDASLGTVAKRLDDAAATNAARSEQEIEDDRLRLIFTCCHPALALDSQVALTLREVCGLTTEEIASAFLTAAPTIAQRIVRGKAKIKTAAIPFVVPSKADIHDRLESVLSVIYLVFNEGYYASSGEMLMRADLSDEAIRLGRLLAELLPDPEVLGLLALMLFTESRRTARVTDTGDLILLEDQDRSRWNRAHIEEGISLAEKAIAAEHVGVYTIQAAIAATHANAADTKSTDWTQIVGWYDILFQANQSPVIELNRAVAIAMRDGPRAGLQLMDAILDRGALAEYHLIHAAKADLWRRLSKKTEARASYETALRLAKQEPERRFLQRRISELG